ncbi:MAG: AAA family ATPase [Rhodocyclaceae bacterium]|nr:AAA family ATPase [Rhodocyclaceae bacterium]
MSESRQKAWPFGFAPLGDLSSIPATEAYRLLVPHRTREELVAIKAAVDEAVQAFYQSAPPEPQPELIAPPVVRAVPRRPKLHQVRVFATDALEDAKRKFDVMDEGQQKYAKAVLDDASKHSGFRALPRIRPALKRLEASQAQFANLREPIEKLRIDLTLAKAMRPVDFHIRPILLAGPPGIGKTHFARQLADALGVSMTQWSAGSAQSAFQLTGSDSSWRQGKPGLILEAMARSDTASPVFVLDEVDKIGKDMNYPVLPVFLDLLERNTARTFEDTFFALPFDASRIIYVLTANDLSQVPEPVLSRVEVFDIPPPEPAQRLQIIQAEVGRLQRATKKRIALDVHAAEALADRTDLDLRQTHRLVVDAFATALAIRKDIATPKVPPRAGRASIGFVRGA